MSLASGTRLGSYKIVSAIGVGGMGEVYRARDTRLGRDVAIKVLAPGRPSSPKARERFRREARAVSSLNHPHICTLYDVEREGDTDFLVMEYLEGQTLAKRIEKGPLPLGELLRLGADVADALESAHRRGVIHRDLKPSNIMLTRAGAKLMDFGLARLSHRWASPSDETVSLEQEGAGQVAPLTAEGTVVGTFQYMSPEQVEGREADTRSDIFAFGAVLYEMATGKRAFDGRSQTSIAAAILEREPRPISELQPASPPALDRAVKTCLAKDPNERFQSAHDVKLQLEWMRDAGSQASAAAALARAPLWHRVLPWAAAGLLTLALAVTLFALLRAPAPPAPSVANLDLDMGKLSLAGRAGSRVVISPDGRKIVFLATGPGSQTQQLYLRSMNNLSITPLPGTQGANQPFFSSDSQWVGFSADGELKKAPLAGGLPVTLCNISGSNYFGVPATWADNGSIYFIEQGNVDRVPEGGGTPQPVAGADQSKLIYRWISALPGSRALLLVAAAGTSGFNIDVLTLETGKSKRLIENGSWPRYLPTGQILYAQYSPTGYPSGFTGELLAVPFDLKRLALTGSPIPVMEGVVVHIGGAGLYDVAANGTMAYFPGRDSMGNNRLAWLDSKGKVEPLHAPSGNYTNLSVSPDGKRVALTETGLSQDIYIYDLIRGTMQRLTFQGRNDKAIFTHDGSRIIYSSTGPNGQVPNLWWRPADGSGNAERLTTSEFLQFPASISPDGKLLAYCQLNPNTSYDIYVMPFKGDSKPRVFVHTPSFDLDPAFSPDGKWIAYMSNESGNFEIYVQSYPGPGGKQQISTGGGANPEWSRDGKKLYYNSGNKLMEVDVTTRPTFSAGTPRLVAANLGIAQAARNFAVAPGGRILLAQRVQQLQESQQGSPPLHVVLNFATEVQNRLRAAKQ